MAISWDINITNANIPSGRADVTFTRTDSESTLTPQTYRFGNTLIETAAQRTALLNTVKQKVEEDATTASTIAAFLGQLEQDGKAALEAWEATR